MQKLKLIVTMVLCFLLVTGCSGHVENIEDEYIDDDIGEEVTSDQTELPEQPDAIPKDLIAATDYFKSVIYVSDEWQDGTYLVYGVDHSDTECYGKLNKTGGVEPITGYGAYFPLAEGNLFATDDDSFVKDFHYEFMTTSSKSICAAGKIVDCDGNILYEPNSADPYQKMYIVNSNTILVLAVSSGFEGIDVYWGVLDHKGNWVHELDNTGILVEIIKNNNLVEVNDDGSWSFVDADRQLVGANPDGSYRYDHRITYTSKGGTFDGKENDSLIFYMETGYHGKGAPFDVELVIYRASSNSFVEMELGYEIKQSQFDSGYEGVIRLQQVADDQWIQLYSYTSHDSYSNKTYLLYDLAGSTSKLENYICTESGIKYWHESKMMPLAGIYHDTVLYSDACPDGVTYPENIVEKKMQYVTVSEGKVIMRIEGADELTYLVIGDLQGNILREPFRPTSFTYPSAISNGLMAYSNYDEGITYVYDLNSEVAEAQIVADICGSPRFLGNGLLGIVVDKDEHMAIYNLNGQKIA